MNILWAERLHLVDLQRTVEGSAGVKVKQLAVQVQVTPAAMQLSWLLTNKGPSHLIAPSLQPVSEIKVQCIPKGDLVTRRQSRDDGERWSALPAAKLRHSLPRAGTLSWRELGGAAAGKRSVLKSLVWLHSGHEGHRTMTKWLVCELR